MDASRSPLDFAEFARAFGWSPGFAREGLFVSLFRGHAPALRSQAALVVEHIVCVLCAARHKNVRGLATPVAHGVLGHRQARGRYVSESSDVDGRPFRRFDVAFGAHFIMGMIKARTHEFRHKQGNTLVGVVANVARERHFEPSSELRFDSVKTSK